MKHDDRLNMRLPKEIAAWIRRSAAKSKIKASEAARAILRQAYDQRHAK